MHSPQSGLTRRRFLAQLGLALLAVPFFGRGRAIARSAWARRRRRAPPTEIEASIWIGHC
jgi:hypothetical protein